MTFTPASCSFLIKGAVSGIPGDFTTRSAVRIRDSVCFPSSHSKPFSSSTSLYLPGIVPESDTNTFHPFCTARIAAPIPDSPAPRIAICLPIPFNYLTLSVTIVITAKMIPTIQNRETIFASCRPNF